MNLHVFCADNDNLFSEGENLGAAGRLRGVQLLATPGHSRGQPRRRWAI